MGRLEEKTRYLIFSFLHNVFDFHVNSFSFSPNFVRIIYHGLFQPKKIHEFTPVYPSQQIESISPSCPYDFILDPPPNTPDIKRQDDGPRDFISKIIYFPQGSVAPNTQSRYMPFQWPQILHDFLAKHYKYLPRFDGELEGLIAEKHLQDFEYFLELFEIDHDDVCVRKFSQFLKGSVQKWFRHLQP